MDSFVEFASGFVNYIRSTYVTIEEESTIVELYEVCERLLQLDLQLSDEGEYTEIFLTLRDLLSAIMSDRERRVIKKGRPGVAIREEQVQYLIDQGFKVKDISLMFGWTAERIMKRYGISTHNYTT